ncbi:MAG: methyl-accepting chemotaxis protein, partial [Chloroflexi bacterium]|nr:methyl-accepting chemotaxis protein [Chloroflexota bacterium]
MKISIKLLLAFFIVSVVPILLVSAAGYFNSRRVSQITIQANQKLGQLAGNNASAIIANLKQQSLSSAAETTVAGGLDDLLGRVQADSVGLAEYAAYLYNHPDTLERYARPGTYEYTTEGAYASLAEEAGTALFVPASVAGEDGRLDAALLDEVELTEYMELEFNRAAHANPALSRLYLTTASQIWRGMAFEDGEPRPVDVQTAFPAEIDLSGEDFYTPADAGHDPQRRPVWSGLRRDPTGTGWVISCLAPVYREDELAAVVGVDVPLAALLPAVLDVQVEQSGFAFLLDADGRVLAFPGRGAGFLGYTEALEGDFRGDVQTPFALAGDEDAALAAAVEAMTAGEAGLTRLTRGGVEYYLNYAPLETIGWSVGVAAPMDEVMAPVHKIEKSIADQNSLALNSVERELDALLKQYLGMTAVILALVVGATLLTTRLISRPIRRLAGQAERCSDDLENVLAGMARVAEGDLTVQAEVLAEEMQGLTRDEIGHTGRSLNRMTAALRETGAVYQRMTLNLRELIGQVAGGANQVRRAAQQLTAVAGQTGVSADNTRETMLQVAEGTTRQADSLRSMLSSAEQMTRAIASVNSGSAQQGEAIQEVAQATGEIHHSLQQAAGNVRAVLQDSAQAAQLSVEGAQTVAETVSGMEQIRAKVGDSARRVAEMGQRSEQIGAIVETI